MVLSQVYDSEKGGTEPETPTECVVIFPRAGNFLEFDGTLAHGVLDSTAQETRMTFLINFWDHRPEVSVLNCSLLTCCTFLINFWDHQPEGSALNWSAYTLHFKLAPACAYLYSPTALLLCTFSPFFHATSSRVCQVRAPMQACQS